MMVYTNEELEQIRVDQLMYIAVLFSLAWLLSCSISSRCVTAISCWQATDSTFGAKLRENLHSSHDVPTQVSKHLPTKCDIANQKVPS